MERDREKEKQRRNRAREHGGWQPCEKMHPQHIWASLQNEG